MTHVKDMIYILAIAEDQLELLSYQDKYKNAIVEVSDKVLGEYDLFIDFGIGDVKDKIEDMWKSFSMAKASCQKKSYTKRDETSGDLLHNLSRCIIECDEERLNQRIDDFYEALTLRTQDIDAFKVKLYEMIVLLNQSVYEEVPVALEESETVFAKLMGIISMPDGKQFLKDYALSVMKSVQEQKSDKTVVIVDKLITYINNHYNENITLEQLSKMSGFSLFYLSKVFKKHMDMNFSDYLSFIRIKVAKRMHKKTLANLLRKFPMKLAM